MRRSLAILTLASLLAAGPVAGQASSYEQLQTFSSIISQIRLNYVDSVTYAELVHAAIDGVLESLDPHSRFVTSADAEREAAYEEGRLAGIGLVLEDVDGGLTVQTVLPASPAAKAGVMAGDRLLSLDDTVVAGLTAETVQRRLIGEKGKKVRLAFQRGPRLAPEAFRVTVKHDIIEARSVGTSRMLNDITGYLRLVGFHPGAGEEFRKALEKLRSSGAKRLILDLRGNPGGSVFSAVEISSLFFKRSVVVFKTEGRTRSASREYITDADGPFQDLPVIALIDRGSASATEALAGSLQDHDRALIIGRRSFGKALMQRALPVPPQGDMVWLTVGRVVTPSGRIIQRSYHGLKAEQYYSFAGRSGTQEDTTAVFRTDHGRQVRGGGGIVPDVVLAEPVPLPMWFFAASDSGFDTAVSDSVAGTLPKDPRARASWIDTPAEWQKSVLPPFMQRVRSRLAVSVEPDSALAARLSRILAYRATEVQWGPDAAEEFILRNDPDIQAATSYLGRIGDLLAAPH